MQYNLNSGFGLLMSQRLTHGLTGKVFLVGKSAIAYRDIYTQIFGVDPDGVPRFHSTIAGALSRCTANAGDMIVVLPGHTETISSATGLQLNVAGVNIFGLGRGSNRPTLTLDTATTATIAVSAANIKLDGFIYVANYADIVSLFTLANAPDFSISNYEVRDTASNKNFLAIIDTDATSNHADGIEMLDGKVFGLGTTSNTCIVKMDGTNTRMNVRGNYFAHAATSGAGFMPIATGKVLTNMLLIDNAFNFVGAAGLTVGTLITTDQTTNSGLLNKNVIFDLDTTSEILVTASSGFKFGINYSSAVADKSGYIVPAQDA